VRALLDVNFLIALLDSDHVAHGKAHAWWVANKNAGWASCAISENGAVRIMSNRRYPGQIPFSSSDVIDALRTFVSNTDHEFWHEDISLRDEKLFAQEHILTSGQLTDIYLLALAAKHEGTLATFDQNISLNPVRIARPWNLTVL
jgi:toxin-antitoxin system PIN domain toxin